MAGYDIYSLDWYKFLAMIEAPSPSQLAILSTSIVEQRECHGYVFDPDDLVSKWPTSVDSLAPLVSERLALSDWYGDLSEMGSELWEIAFYVACMRQEELNLDFSVESNGVYWNVIDRVVQHLGDSPEQPGKSAMSRFGTVPFRCSSPSKRDQTSWWVSMHSMHPPEEVKRMLLELRSVEPLMEEDDDGDVRYEFFEELLPAIERVAEGGRLLFVQVDT